MEAIVEMVARIGSGEIQLRAGELLVFDDDIMMCNALDVMSALMDEFGISKSRAATCVIGVAQLVRGEMGRLRSGE